MTHDLERDDIIALIKKSSSEELDGLCAEIRDFLLEHVSRTGGHLASNLGIVELTVAMHKVYHSPKDKLIFDVGHQTYVHKIITGRAGAFDTLRKFKGLSGFPKSRESAHDPYDTGHSSTSLGAAAGFAAARDLRGEDHEVVALIGDGAMTGGLVYEALNNIGSNHTKVRIILNDNGMSIACNTGAMSRHLQKLRTSENYLSAKDSVRGVLEKVPGVGSKVVAGISKTKDKLKYSVLADEGILFEDLGFKYIGPIDGYNIEELCEAFRAANAVNGPTIVHVITTKGKGYYWSEKYPRKFHGVGPFSIEDGNLLSQTTETYSKQFGNCLTELAEKDRSIVAISAAMGTATGLTPFWKAFPERFFDVGIAEQHAVLFAAGLAKAGMKPVAAIYSSFLQRAYDQIIEDVCLQNLHVVFAIDRAGLVGADGETHHGVFDLSYLGSIPNMTIFTPADGNQLQEMLHYALNEMDSPVAIRYPRGSAEGDHLRLKPFTGGNTVLSEGKDVAVLAVGSMLDEALEAVRLLREDGIDAGVHQIGCVKPFDEDLEQLRARLIVTVEDNVRRGGFGESVAARYAGRETGVLIYALPDAFVEQGSPAELREACGLTASHIVKGVKAYLEGKA